MKVLIKDTIFMSPTKDRTAILRDQPGAMWRCSRLRGKNSNQLLVNPLSSNIQIQILQTDLHTFPYQ